MTDPTASDRASSGAFDRTRPLDTQEVWDTTAIRQGHLRVRTLTNVRWMVVFGEVLVLGLGLLFQYQMPFVACALVIGAGALVNFLTGLAWSGQRLLTDREALIQLTFDVLQMSALLALVGGTANPFIVILLAPATLAAATLARQPFFLICLLAALASMVLAVASLPYPIARPIMRLSLEHRLVAGVANVAGIALVAGFVRQSMVEAARMALALDMTQAVLAREQRLSALGALAAAAAHELGTPLATISIVAKELAREAPTPRVKDDADLLVAQAERCREILRRLTAMPDKAADAVHEQLSLRQLVQEIIEPHSGAFNDVRIEAIVSGSEGVAAPQIRRLPELAHAFASFVDNAVDFARAEVLVSARFDHETISIEVRDDGRGFAPDVLDLLGEPYVTSRAGVESSRSGHSGIGLGFFIAKTLLERTGAVLTYRNGRTTGAVVTARWRRPDLEIG